MNRFNQIEKYIASIRNPAKQQYACEFVHGCYNYRKAFKPTVEISENAKHAIEYEINRILMSIN
jgi:hypothetical protein